MQQCDSACGLQVGQVLEEALHHLLRYLQAPTMQSPSIGISSRLNRGLAQRPALSARAHLVNRSILPKRLAPSLHQSCPNTLLEITPAQHKPETQACPKGANQSLLRA